MRILRTAELAKLLRVDPTTIWRWWAKDNVLPKPIQLGPNVHGWQETTIEKWLAERPEAGHE
ncbi:helix-turn-helix transcriptional regulator [Mesorhizobium yinganensis]|uniref:helix-turn-helix transcriptional regulator n=1 Tax=Mesorhizobium yinganensis TaxID=3157707 RepID=UPI003CCD09AA